MSDIIWTAFAGHIVPTMERYRITLGVAPGAEHNNSRHPSYRCGAVDCDFANVQPNPELDPAYRARVINRINNDDDDDLLGGFMDLLDGHDNGAAAARVEQERTTCGKSSSPDDDAGPSRKRYPYTYISHAADDSVPSTTTPLAVNAPVASNTTPLAPVASTPATHSSAAVQAVKPTVRPSTSTQAAPDRPYTSAPAALDRPYTSARPTSSTFHHLTYQYLRAQIGVKILACAWLSQDSTSPPTRQREINFYQSFQSSHSTQRLSMGGLKNEFSLRVNSITNGWQPRFCFIVFKTQEAMEFMDLDMVHAVKIAHTRYTVGRAMRQFRFRSSFVDRITKLSYLSSPTSKTCFVAIGVKKDRTSPPPPPASPTSSDEEYERSDESGTDEDSDEEEQCSDESGAESDGGNEQHSDESSADEDTDEPGDETDEEQRNDEPTNKTIDEDIIIID